MLRRNEGLVFLSFLMDQYSTWGFPIIYGLKLEKQMVGLNQALVLGRCEPKFKLLKSENNEQQRHSTNMCNYDDQGNNHPYI
ncbi:Uncharacterized protein TCM_029224 [Theobroma cacao]|uniref:Uncharacterized protein n=1 Tax=Theobroma cacao TaxID=3641 RepID=A0A061GDX8_THECC|nr:Uncharacterized protein TCM_029224 [Theobroma cacao]